MKSTLALFALIALMVASSGPTFAATQSGQFVCASLCHVDKPGDKYCSQTNGLTSDDFAKTLNALDCDTTKHFTTTPNLGSIHFGMVCCVHK